MKYLIGEQVIEKGCSQIHIITDYELINGVDIYYTLSGKSFSESQIIRYHCKTIDEYSERLMNNFDFTVTITDPYRLTMEGLLESMNKRELETEQRKKQVNQGHQIKDVMDNKKTLISKIKKFFCIK